LDNTFSRFSHKQVFFEFMTEHDDDDDDQFKKFTALPDDLSKFDMKLDDFLVRTLNRETSHVSYVS